VGEEICSVACVSVREADLCGIRLLLPRGHARREKVRVRGSLLEFDTFGIRSPGRRFHPRGRVRGGFLPAPRSQAQCFFHLVQGTIVMAPLVAERAGDPALGGARRSSDVQILFVADPIAVDERRARDASRTRKSTSSMIAVCCSEANVKGRLFSCSVASRSIIRLSPCSKMSAGLPGS
jgi:hypothetical protein